MFKGILGSLVAVTLFLVFMVPPGFLILIELALVFIPTILFWYWLFKIKPLEDFLNQTAVTWITGSSLIAFNAVFVFQIALLLMGGLAFVEHYFMAFLGLFCLTASLYLNQNVIDKNKTLLVGTGIMSCAATGGLYCVLFPTEFLGSQMAAAGSCIGAGVYCMELLGILSS